MLLGNYNKNNSNPGRNIGGASNPYDWMKVSNVMKFYYGEASRSGVTNKSSFNNGYVPPYSYVLAPKGGGLAMNIKSTGSLVVDLVPQYLAISSFSGSGTMDSTISVYGNLICALIGSSTYSADITATGNIVISFSGQGDLTATILGNGNIVINLTGASSLNSDIIGKGNILSDLIGSGVLSGDLSLIILMLATLTGSNTFTSTIKGNGNIDINLIGDGSLSGVLAILAGMICSMVGSGTLSADIILFRQLVCSMIGSGTLSADAIMLLYMLTSLDGNGELTANITGQKSPTCSMIGSGNLSSNINGLGSILLDLSGIGDLDANIESIANMSIDLVVTGTGLTTSNVGAAVWNALQTEINNTGTAGAALLAAGSAGDPWSTILPAGYSGTQAGNILAQIQTLIDELHKIEGLSEGNPMTVTQTNRSAGSINLDITGDGETETIVTRND